jgi:hypothetical protein
MSGPSSALINYHSKPISHASTFHTTHSYIIMMNDDDDDDNVHADDYDYSYDYIYDDYYY